MTGVLDYGIGNIGSILNMIKKVGAQGAAVGRGSVWGTQFHPEKSHRFGMCLIRNFVKEA